MNTFQYDLKVKAPSVDEANRKVNAVGALLDGLTTIQLEKLAYVVKHDPAKLALGLRYL